MALSASFFCFFRGARKPPAEIKTVAIFQNAKMGDMICTTPIFRAIKKHRPGVRVVVIGNRVNREILNGHKDIDVYIVHDNVWRTAALLRKEKIDFGLVPLPNLDSLIAFVFGGSQSIAAPTIIGGRSPYETISYRILSFFTIKVPHRLGAYAPREYLRLLEPMGIKEDDTTKHLTVSPEATRTISAFFDRHHVSSRELIIGILPSAGNPVKIWPTSRFAALADWLYERYRPRIIILGASADRQRVDRVITALSPKTAVIDACGLFGGEELKALIAQLTLLIAPDTGAIYIAEAFGVPTIDIVGPVDEKDQPPRGDFHLIVAAPRAKPAMGVVVNIGFDPIEVKRQIEEISVAMVAAAVEKLIGRLRSAV